MDTYSNEVLVTVPGDQAEHALAELRKHVESGDFAAWCGTPPAGDVAIRERTDGHGLILDFDTEDQPMLDGDLGCLLEKAVHHWGGGLECGVHSIFHYPEDHPGNEPGARTYQGRPTGDIVMRASFMDGIGVSTFSNVMPEWGVAADRW